MIDLCKINIQFFSCLYNVFNIYWCDFFIVCIQFYMSYLWLIKEKQLKIIKIKDNVYIGICLQYEDVLMLEEVLSGYLWGMVGWLFNIGFVDRSILRKDENFYFMLQVNFLCRKICLKYLWEIRMG